MSEKYEQSGPKHRYGYQASFAGLKGKDGKPLQRKDLKPPKGGSAIVRPKPPASDKPSPA